mmetsp:Transcript_33129/g.52710  ORF Transcript_33129/g.52710 Transcript_33129/m.52710 type:complete len:135 (+) Transcript_33129:846-1250(+)
MAKKGRGSSMDNRCLPRRQWKTTGNNTGGMDDELPKLTQATQSLFKSPPNPKHKVTIQPHSKPTATTINGDKSNKADSTSFVINGTHGLQSGEERPPSRHGGHARILVIYKHGIATFIATLANPLLTSCVIIFA